MIEVNEVTRRYGNTTAVDQLSFKVKPGTVTGFLGPNGAGKTTTMRMILGLDRPTSGSVTVNGKSYADLPAPMREIGALLDAKAIQGGRTARNHLGWMARAGRLPMKRVDEALDLVGLTDVADRTVGGFSLGMSQRLGLAAALLGDPEILILDEPVNGLDPEGIRWIRSLLKRFANDGRTIFLSSHLMSEMEETADHVIVIGRGKLIADASITDFTKRSTQSHLRVVSPQATELSIVLRAAGASVVVEDGVLIVTGMESPQVGYIAAEHRMEIHELALRRASLEEAFMELTVDSIQYQPSEPEAAAVAG